MKSSNPMERSRDKYKLIYTLFSLQIFFFFCCCCFLSNFFFLFQLTDCPYPFVTFRIWNRCRHTQLLQARKIIYSLIFFRICGVVLYMFMFISCKLTLIFFNAHSKTKKHSHITNYLTSPFRLLLSSVVVFFL